MIRRALFLTVVGVAALAFSLREASAQFGFVGGYGVNYGDMVSPYLNLLSQNSSGGYGTYQNLVQSFQNDRLFNERAAGNINQLQNQINGNPYGGAGGGRRGTTSKYFLNYSHYYLGIRH